MKDTKFRVLVDQRHELSSVSSNDCDCACAYVDTVTINRGDKDLISPEMAYRSADEVHVQHISKDHFAIFPGTNGGIVVLDKNALNLWESFLPSRGVDEILRGYPDSVHPFIRQTSQIFLDIGLLRSSSSLSINSQHTIPNGIVTWLHVTDRCNLRCAYCYLPHNAVDMSLETGKAVVNTLHDLVQQHLLSNIKIKYAGGEPLLRFDIVSALHEYARTKLTRNNIALDGVVLSNGTLLDASIIGDLLNQDLRLSISLDNLPSDRYCQRMYADGRDSSNDAIRAIELALARGLTPSILITVSNRNIGGLPELLEWVLARELPFTLNLYRENDRSISQRDLPFRNERLIKGMLAAYRVIESNLPSHSLLTSLLDRVNLAGLRPCACGAGQNYLVFDTVGQVSKCPMDMSHPVAGIGENLDLLHAIRYSPKGLQNPSIEENQECQNCEWRYFCASGCPLQRHRVFGSYNARSPNCEIYKALIPEVLRLEGLRLLKYADMDASRNS